MLGGQGQKLKDAGNLLMFVGNGTDGEHQLQFQQKAGVLCKQIFYSGLLCYQK